MSNSASLATNQTGINSLLVFDLPAEIGWKAWDLPMRIFGEFADNIEGHDRAHAAADLGGFEAHTGQHYAWMIGGAIGQLKTEGRLGDPGLVSIRPTICAGSQPG